MNLINKMKRLSELEENKNYLENMLKNKRDILDNLLYPKPNIEEIKVEGGTKKNPVEKIINEICDLELDLLIITKEYETLKSHIERLKVIAKEHHDNSLEVLELRMKGYKKISIAEELSISESTVHRRLDELGLVNKRK